MNIYELKKFRDQLYKDISDENSITENDFIDYALEILLDSKLIDNKSNNESFINSFVTGANSQRRFKINSFIINETGERLQLFIVDEDGLFASKDEEVLQSTLEYYNNVFNLGENFIKLALSKRLNEIPESGSINSLVTYMSSLDGMHTIDSIDLFLISPTITYQKSGSGENLKDFDFKDQEVDIKYSKLKPGAKNDYETFSKSIPIYRHLININYLYNNHIATGNRTQLVIDFKELDFPNIKMIEAVNEDKFESYIAVLPANLLTKLYQKYSFRLLEKNVRSFLQFKGPNKGMRETLQKEPEKFIAYNNGLTITATDKDIDENGFINSLTDFQIVNGGQTTASIYFSKKDNIDVSKVYVTAKINIAKNSTDDELEDLITNISKFSNSQTKVSVVDLRSRNVQLGKIKSLSESILTPSSQKWFFEKSRGEFNTMLRMSSNRKNVEKQYPRERRLSKEQLGKFYSAWGDKPHLIKKGGEAVFKMFIENIDEKAIGRDFYEDLIGRVILFTSLEKLHGTRDKAISQIRSAIIPYTISIIHEYTDKSKQDDFNFFKIWKDEKLSDRANTFFHELMTLVLKVIKDNATSDDLSENSKKEELWNNVIKSQDIKFFMTSKNAELILKEYAIKKSEKKKLLNSKKKKAIIDFEILKLSADIYDKGEVFIRTLSSKFYDVLSEADNYTLGQIQESIKSINKSNFIPLHKNTIEKFEKIKGKILKSNSEDFDKLLEEYNNSKYARNVDWIINKYNDCLKKDEDFYTYFKVYSDLAIAKKIKYSSVFKEISDQFKKNELPNINHIYLLTEYIDSIEKE
ncbi:AIPR family protein [Empedobacter falsenii]|uniref:AIPR family protein n=1 Tax=Empedobacter falsenii TaxID=343874 RepID=UPI003A7FDAAB